MGPRSDTGDAEANGTPTGATVAPIRSDAALQRHTDVAGLEQLPKLVTQQRGLLAGTLRIRREETENHHERHRPDLELAKRPALEARRRVLAEQREKIVPLELKVREDIAALLERAGVAAVECVGFAVRHNARPGRPAFATVTPIR